MDRRAFLRRTSSLAFTSALLSACGGGGSGDAETDADTSSSSSTASSTASNTNATISTPPGAAAKARVIVVGGGMAGATVAKYLRLWGDMIDVTLVERQSSYCLLYTSRCV